MINIPHTMIADEIYQLAAQIADKTDTPTREVVEALAGLCFGEDDVEIIMNGRQ